MALPVVSLLQIVNHCRKWGAMIENRPLLSHEGYQPTSAQVAATPPTDFTRSGVVDLVIPVYTFVAGSRGWRHSTANSPRDTRRFESSSHGRTTSKQDFPGGRARGLVPKMSEPSVWFAV